MLAQLLTDILDFHLDHALGLCCASAIAEAVGEVLRVEQSSFFVVYFSDLLETVATSTSSV